MCQKHGKSLSRFKFKLSDESITFNYTIYVDIIHLDSRNILYVIDEGTQFRVGRFLKDTTTKHI